MADKHMKRHSMALTTGKYRRDDYNKKHTNNSKNIDRLEPP